MPLHDYYPSGEWPDLDGSDDGPLQVYGDVDVMSADGLMESDSPKRGLIGKLIDACDHLKKHAGASLVAAYSGAVWTIAAGPLADFLHALADKAAKLDATTNTFTGNVYAAAVEAPALGCEGLVATESAQVQQLTVVGVMRDAPPVYLSDADHTIDLADGQRYVMLTSPAANRTITCPSTATAGDWFELTVMLGSSTHLVLVIRSGSAGAIAQIGDEDSGSPYDNANQPGTVRVQYDGSAWRLAAVGGGKVFYGSDA